MLPTVVLVGRPNVGKSTLFNRLTRSRAAIVADTPGVTRDRHFGRGRMGDRPYLVVDTGGFEPQATEGLAQSMASQTLQAISEGDAVVFLMRWSDQHRRGFRTEELPEIFEEATGVRTHDVWQRWLNHRQSVVSR